MTKSYEKQSSFDLQEKFIKTESLKKKINKETKNHGWTNGQRDHFSDNPNGSEKKI